MGLKRKLNVIRKREDRGVLVKRASGPGRAAKRKGARISTQLAREERIEQARKQREKKA